MTRSSLSPIAAHVYSFCSSTINQPFFHSVDTTCVIVESCNLAAQHQLKRYCTLKSFRASSTAMRCDALYSAISCVSEQGRAAEQTKHQLKIV